MTAIIPIQTKKKILPVTFCWPTQSNTAWHTIYSSPKPRQCWQPATSVNDPVIRTQSWACRRKSATLVNMWFHVVKLAATETLKQQQC